MQYHQDGFKIGNPRVAKALDKSAKPLTHVDVLIVGCGPAGLTLAAQLSAFNDITTRIVDQKSGPLEVGQADGIACRSMEMFEAFGFAKQVEEEAYWVNETSFWRPNDAGLIGRTERIQDVEDGLSEFPHTILSQARIHDFYLEVMKNSAHRLEPDYNRLLVRLEKTGDADYPVTAEFDCLDEPNNCETIHARYVVGCDGARSEVRRSLGLELKGDSARQLWGVMDVLAVTDFPDVRLKCAIQSTNNGSLLIIPREGGFMVRMYIELDELVVKERAADRNVTSDALIAKAKAILAPYSLEVKQVAWWSAYEIGQRVCSSFDDVSEDEKGKTHPRIFIAGDACHTHSPKAGQGMNVSMADTFNLGWKLASVLRDQSPWQLLSTFDEERQAKAEELIEFDRDMARLFSARKTDGSVEAEFQRYFAKHARYTAGVETHYAPSLITSNGAYQHLATGFQIGMRFHSAPVIRLGDAKREHLAHTIKADGRWRLFVFAGSDDVGDETGALAAFSKYMLDDPTSLRNKLIANGLNVDEAIDMRAILQQNYRSLDCIKMPRLFVPNAGALGVVDYEKVFCAVEGQDDIFDLRSINRKTGCIVIVRPDQYVSEIFPMDAMQSINAFFEGVFIQNQ